LNTREGKITDQGPYADPKRRIIDLSKAAANSIWLVEEGVGPIRVTVTEKPAAAQKRKVRSYCIVTIFIASGVNALKLRVIGTLQPALIS
jgi:rare lipoprotein A (peptidoglycan hydrolase)